VVVKKIAATLPRRNYRLWYWALMDYGAHLKKEYGNINSKSKQYRAQSKFQGSHRQLRGQVLRLLSHQALSAASLSQKLQKPSVLVAAALATLCKEGLISKNRHFYRIG
jgi:A/G-specific adenine glycosylase